MTGVVCYSEGVNIRSACHGGGIGGLVMSGWRGLWPELEVLESGEATLDEMSHAHSRFYVSEMVGGRRRTGYGVQDRAISDALPSQAGALLMASRVALERGCHVAAPVYGATLAGTTYPTGMCSLNMVAIAALALADRGVRVGVLDYGFRFGLGTDEIIARSIYRGSVLHLSAGKMWAYSAPGSVFLESIALDLDALGACDLVIYQAGADQCVDDPLGGLLTVEQMAERDRRVFAGLRGKAVAWCLGMSYQPASAAVELHVQSMRAARS